MLSEFRQRLLDGGAEHRLLEKLFGECEELGLLKKRGRQRTDCTRVLAAVRRLSRLELLGETMRAALNEIATEAPEWLKRFAPLAWYERYGRRVEEHRLPRSKAKRKAYAREVGEDGFALLEAVERPDAPDGLGELPKVEVLRRVWEVHYTHVEEGPEQTLRLTTRKERPARAEEIESPYDPEAKLGYLSSAGGRTRTQAGYRVHFSETCDEGQPRLITTTDTTIAPAHEVRRIGPIHDTLAEKGLLPSEHLARLRLREFRLGCREPCRAWRRGSSVRPCSGSSWQSKNEEAFGTDDFEFDWAPWGGAVPRRQHERDVDADPEGRGKDHVRIRFAAEDCHTCPPKRALHDGQDVRATTHDPTAEAVRGTSGSAARERWLPTPPRHLRGHYLAERSRRVGLRQTLVPRRSQDTSATFSYGGGDQPPGRLVGWFEDRPLAWARISHFAALMATA